MEKEDTVSVQWAQEDLEMSYNLLNDNNNNNNYAPNIRVIKLRRMRLVEDVTYMGEV